MKRNFFSSFNFFWLFFVVLLLCLSKVEPVFAQSCGGTYDCLPMVPDGFGGLKCPTSGGSGEFSCAWDNGQCQPPLGPCGNGPNPCLVNNCGTFVLPTLPIDYYDYKQCPTGQAISCGSQTEAIEQNKQSCLYKKTCDKYFWTSTRGAGCAADNPAKAICSWNCSCCATGSYRTCTQGEPYTKSITIDLTNGDFVANEVAKVTCNLHSKLKCNTCFF